MEISEAAAAHPQKDSVKVAVNIRPLITVELQEGCTDCVTVTPGEPQVPIVVSDWFGLLVENLMFPGLGIDVFIGIACIKIWMG